MQYESCYVFVGNLHFYTDRFQLKREISRTMTFCLYYANTFVERHEKTIKILPSLLLVFDGRCKSNHQWNSICLYGQRIFKCYVSTTEEQFNENHLLSVLQTN